MTRSEILAETRSSLATAFLSEHETPSPLTLAEARYNMRYWAEDGVEYPEGPTPSVLVEAWNSLCYNDNNNSEEETTMKKSEVITKNYDALRDKMRECYRSVLNSDGQIQYKIFIWSDGVIETLEGCQGDSSWLQAPDYETRELYEVCKIDAPCFDPWDYADHSAPEDETEREDERTEIIDWLVSEYDPDDILDAVISDAQFDEEDDEEF